MAFERQPVRTPVRIGELQAFLTSADPLGSDADGAVYRFAIVFDDGSTDTRVGNLVPYLTPDQITALLAFMADLRGQAAQQVLPE